MAHIFTFIKHPILSLMEASGTLVPGIKKVISVYFDYRTNRILCKGINEPYKNKVAEDFIIIDSNQANKLREEKKSSNWLNVESLPFEISEEKKIQLDIFDEVKNVVLCIAIPNKWDNKTDLLFIYLNENKGNFGISNSDKSLTTDEKAIVGSLVSNSLLHFYNQQEKNSITLKLINKKIQQIQSDNQETKNKFEILRKEFQTSIVENCNEHLKKISENFEIKFEFSAKALEKLKVFTGNIEQLKQNISDAAELALNTNFGSDVSTILLHEWDINFIKSKVIENTEQPILQERYQKTWTLLEKLEKAASTVINTNLKPTSENVGNACPTPISAPAISDALKNHHKKVVKLMQEYPDKWKTIRNEFKPVKNILSEQLAG